MNTSRPPRSGYFKPSEIGPESTAFYKENGYLVVTDVLDQAAIDELKAETVRLCRGMGGKIQRTGTDSGFLDDDPSKSDEDIQKEILCIHYPHKVSERVYRHLADKTTVDVLTRIIGPNVKCMQSMLFIKSSGKPGQAWHQDEDFIPTRDRSLAGAWIAIDDATVENGCLWIIPGSHKPGILWPMFAHTDKRFDCTHESYNFPYTDDQAISVEVKAGSIVFFNGYTLHRSLPNVTESGFRRSLVNHYMSAESLLPWRYEENKKMAEIDFRDIVMVAGEDPYPWKPTENIRHAFLRPDGRGGCDDGRILA